VYCPNLLDAVSHPYAIDFNITGLLKVNCRIEQPSCPIAPKSFLFCASTIYFAASPKTSDISLGTP